MHVWWEPARMLRRVLRSALHLRCPSSRVWRGAADCSWPCTASSRWPCRERAVVGGGGDGGEGQVRTRQAERRAEEINRWVMGQEATSAATAMIVSLAIGRVRANVRVARRGLCSGRPFLVARPPSPLPIGPCPMHVSPPFLLPCLLQRRVFRHSCSPCC